MKIPPIGMRTIKTGIGSFLCAILGKIGLIDNPFFAVGACVVSMQNTIKDSFNSGFNRAKGTLVGGFFGYIFALYFKDNILLCSIGLILAIYVCNLLNLKSSIQICGIVYASIAFTIAKQDPLTYSIYRTIDTTLGVFVGVFVNYIISRPDLSQEIITKIEELKKLSIDMLNNKIHSNKIDLSCYENNLNYLCSIIEKYIEEYSRNIKEIPTYDFESILFILKELKIHFYCIEKIHSKILISEDNTIEINSILNLDLTYEPLNYNINLYDLDASTIYNYHLNEILYCINEVKAWIDIHTM